VDHTQRGTLRKKLINGRNLEKMSRIINKIFNKSLLDSPLNISRGKKFKRGKIRGGKKTMFQTHSSKNNE
jgi:hypothetical protein